MFRLCTLFLLLFSSIYTSLNAQFYRREEELDALVVRTIPVEVNDHGLVKRIISSYQLANKKHLGNSMWQTFFDERHKWINNVFESGNVEQSAFILRNPGLSDLFWGIDNLCATILARISSSPSEAISNAKSSLDLLIRCGEAIGAITLDYPEAYHIPPRKWDGKNVVQILENHLNFLLNFPNPYPDEFGVWTTLGVVSYRVPYAIYQAWLIKKLTAGIENPRILEIGAGLGRTAYYAKLMGIDDYTIVDLPLGVTCSAYFLGRTLGEDNILLLGENCNNPEKRIKIFTPDQFLNDSKQYYDLIINVDSFTEMDFKNAINYADKIKASTPIFVSINHEVNSFTVRQLFIDIKDYERKPYWMRNGYVEEIFRINSKYTQ